MAREGAKGAAKPVERRTRRSRLAARERAAETETTRAAPVGVETVGQRIRRLRLERGLSQRELAGPGVCSAHVSAIETGHRQAALATLRVLAARLGVIPFRLLPALSSGRPGARREPVGWLGVDGERARGRAGGGSAPSAHVWPFGFSGS